MNAVLNFPRLSSSWRTALPPLLMLLALILLLYRDTFAAMAEIWTRSETFAHAWLVPPIVLWLVWRRRAALVDLVPSAQPWMILPMALAALVWLLGDTAGINALTQLCATTLLVLAVPAVLGLAVARQIAFPLMFLFFMVPIGDFLLPLMMEATADFTVAAVALSGVPVYREGLQFHIPTGAWSVVEACSGVRYLIASFMVGTLFAYLNYRSAWRRWTFVGVAIVVPVVANWLRAYMIVMLGHLSGNTLAVGVDHLIYGWVFFGVVIGLMFMIGSRWVEPEADVPSKPWTDAIRRDAVSSKAWPVSAMAAVAIALPAALAAQMAHPDVLSPVTIRLPDLPGVPGNELENPSFVPLSPNATSQANRAYGAGVATVGVHVAYFRHQRYGAKLAGSDNVLVRSNDKHWNRLRTGLAKVAVFDNPALEVNASELVASSTGSDGIRARLDVRQVFWSGGQFTASGQWATVLGVFSRLTGRGDDGAIVTIYTEGDAAATESRLNAFFGAHFRAIESELIHARGIR